MFKRNLAGRLGLSAEILFGNGTTLRDAVSLSPNATNSIDLLEGFAGALADLEWDDFINLPAFTLDNTVDSVIDEIEAQVRAHGE